MQHRSLLCCCCTFSTRFERYTDTVFVTVSYKKQFRIVPSFFSIQFSNANHSIPCSYLSVNRNPLSIMCVCLRLQTRKFMAFSSTDDLSMFLYIPVSLPVSVSVFVNVLTVMHRISFWLYRARLPLTASLNKFTVPFVKHGTVYKYTVRHPFGFATLPIRNRMMKRKFNLETKRTDRNSSMRTVHFYNAG